MHRQYRAEPQRMRELHPYMWRFVGLIVHHPSLAILAAMAGVIDRAGSSLFQEWLTESNDHAPKQWISNACSAVSIRQNLPNRERREPLW